MSRKSMVVSGLGLGSSFLVALDKARQTRGVTDEQFHLAIKDDSPLVGKFADLMVTTFGGVRLVRIPVTLNYNEPLEAKTASGFNYANPNLTEKNFGEAVGTGTVKTEATLVRFGRYIATDEEVISLMDGIGLRPAIPKELADVSKSNPDSAELAACFPAAAIGDSWVRPFGHRFVADLRGDAAHRKLNLYVGDYWDAYWWFLGFRK